MRDSIDLSKTLWLLSAQKQVSIVAPLLVMIVETLKGASRSVREEDLGDGEPSGGDFAVQVNANSEQP